MAFDHEKLDVYQLAIGFIADTRDIIEDLPRGHGHIADQLRRASLSVVLNLAEGAGKFSPDDKAAFYLRARGSTTEIAAVLDVCRRLSLIGDDCWNHGLEPWKGHIGTDRTDADEADQAPSIWPCVDGLGRGLGLGHGRRRLT